MNQLLDDLNEVQREAVIYNDGPSLVIAGAGSGKTRVLTYKIAYLLSKGYSARSILALTFTNKAAKEMKERIGRIVGEGQTKYLWMGTFHSIFARILRLEASALGYDTNFTIYDTSDSKSIIRSIIKELNLDNEIYKPDEVFSRISMVKNNLITVQNYINNANILAQDKAARKPYIGEIYGIYSQRCKKANAMDFDDLLLNTNILFRDFPEILEKYRSIFSYILVDEYQDTNLSQYLIVRTLSKEHKKICVVGDDAQSIYAFRGARIENILNFKNDYPDYKLFKLEENYRSTKTIVNAANSIIAKNKEQIHKIVFSNKEEGEAIRVIKAHTDVEEGYLIANDIKNLREKNKTEYKQIAILYRTNAQSRIFEETFSKFDIPYKIYGSLSFYQRKEIKDLLAYFRIIVNPNDDEALKRIINYPSRGIGDTTIEKIDKYASQNNQSIWSVIAQLENYETNISQGIIKKIIKFVEYIKELQEKLNLIDAHELASIVIRTSGILNEIKSENIYESNSRIENVDELLNSIKEFIEETKEENSNQLITLDMYLEKVALLTDSDTNDVNDNDKVRLMTIHASKGLEFDYVYIAGLEEGLFPSIISLSRDEELEEERRLFYVAVTRAAKKVTISYANSRYKWGKTVFCIPSRFIDDIDEKYIEYANNSRTTSVEEYDENQSYKVSHSSNNTKNNISIINLNQLSRKLIDIKSATKKKLTESDENNYCNSGYLAEGTIIEHQHFGRGKILSIEGSPPNDKATVRFDTGEEKKLLLKFAKLKVVE